MLSDKRKAKHIQEIADRPKKPRTPPTLLKPSLEIEQLPPKKAAIMLLTKENVKNEDIAKVVGLKESSVGVYLSKLKKFTFTGNVKAQKGAYKTISALSKGLTPKGSNIDEVKDSTAFQASKYISDHNDPVIQHVQTEPSVIIGVIAIDSLT